MATLSDAQIATYARAAGFSGAGLVTAIAVALAESGGNPSAVGNNRNGAGRVTSVDRGLWQINSVFHAEITNACAFDPKCAAQAAFRISARGSNWTPWATFNSGAYRQFLARANTAAGGGASVSALPSSTPPKSPSGVGGIPGLPTSAFTGTPDIQGETLALGEQSASNFWSGYRWTLALLVMGGFLWVIARTKAGYVALYYGEALILLFLFATQAQFFREALGPFLSKSPTQTASGGQEQLTVTV